MKFLLDINVLLAGIIQSHVEYARTKAWLEGKDIVLCPLSELGFLRISTNPRTFGSSMPNARTALANFCRDRKAERIACDLNALDSHPRTSNEVTDHYLADLAKKHGFKLATLDQGLKHPSAVLVP